MDYCSFFPEKWRGIYIGDCCKKHDGDCSTHKFRKCLRERIGKVSAFFISIGGGLGCWVKYTSKMFRRV